MEHGLEADASQELCSSGEEWPSPSSRTTVPAPLARMCPVLCCEPDGVGLHVKTDGGWNCPGSFLPSTAVPQGACGVLGARPEVPLVFPDASKAFAWKVKVRCCDQGTCTSAGSSARWKKAVSPAPAKTLCGIFTSFSAKAGVSGMRS